jgi:hypothetical protein
MLLGIDPDHPAVDRLAPMLVYSPQGRGKKDQPAIVSKIQSEAAKLWIVRGSEAEYWRYWVSRQVAVGAPGLETALRDVFPAD